MKNNNSNKSFLSFSLSKGFVCPNIPIATFYQGNKEINFIIDTGSDDNVISEDALSDIQYEKTDYSGTISGIGGSFDVTGCNISFQYGDESFTALFIVSNTLKDAFDRFHDTHAIRLHGMLGSKFLKENGIVLDFKKLMAYNDV